jgi:branched-subunit amino acid transport protein
MGMRLCALIGMVVPGHLSRVPAVLYSGGKLSVGLGHDRLVGAVVTVLSAFWKKTLLFTMGAGMVFLRCSLRYQVLLADLSAI